MPSRFVIAEVPNTLTIEAWTDPAIDASGHRPGSAYIEAVWLGSLGPTATFAWMRLARVAAATPGVVVDTTDLAVSLGLGESLSRSGALARSIGRLIAFDAAYLGRRLRGPPGAARRVRGSSAAPVVVRPGRPRPLRVVTVMAATHPAAAVSTR